MAYSLLVSSLVVPFLLRTDLDRVILEDLVEVLFTVRFQVESKSASGFKDLRSSGPTHIFNASLPSTVANSGVSTLRNSSVVRITFLFPLLSAWATFLTIHSRSEVWTLIMCSDGMRLRILN
jgi:hypothetical protein